MDVIDVPGNYSRQLRRQLVEGDTSSQGVVQQFPHEAQFDLEEKEFSLLVEIIGKTKKN